MPIKNFRPILIFLTAFLIYLLAQPSAGLAGIMEEIKRKGVLTVGVKADYYPWGGINEKGQHVGLEIDLARDIARRLGVKLKTVSVTAVFRLQKLEMKEIDLVIATMAGTAKRARLAYLIEPPYYSSGATILVKKASTIKSWADIRGRKICLLRGAFYNKNLKEQFAPKELIYNSVRDAKSALRDGHCEGWVYDDTVLKQLLLKDDWREYHLPLASIEGTPWTMAVNREYAGSEFALFLQKVVVDWHRSKFILATEEEWGLPPSPYLVEMNTLLNAKSPDGEYLCDFNKKEILPAACQEATIDTTIKPVDKPSWILYLEKHFRINPGFLLDSYNQNLLINGFKYTVLLSVVSILVAIAAGIFFAVFRCSKFWLWRTSITAISEFFRLTPPLLHLYIIFFGIGSYLSAGLDLFLNPVLVAVFSFSIYTGAANGGILEAAMLEYREQNSKAKLHRQIIKAIDASYENLRSNLVNLVKLAGMSSVIAVPEIISSSAMIVARDGNQILMMNILLVFYLLYVSIFIWLLKHGKTAIEKWALTI